VMGAAMAIAAGVQKFGIESYEISYEGRTEYSSVGSYATEMAVAGVFAMGAKGIGSIGGRLLNKYGGKAVNSIINSAEKAVSAAESKLGSLRQSIQNFERKLINSAENRITNFRGKRVSIDDVYSANTATMRGFPSVSSVKAGYRELPSRLNFINETLENAGDYMVVGRKQINLNDIRYLSELNNVEYALLTRGKQRMVVRGEYKDVALPKPGYELGKEGWRWSGHTHVTRANRNTDDQILLTGFRLGQEEMGFSVQRRSRVLDLNKHFDLTIEGLK
jgi:hypothetical protein